MSPTVSLSKDLRLLKDLFATVSQALPAEPASYYLHAKGLTPLQRLTVACEELSAQPEAYAVSLLNVFFCKPGRRDVENKILTEPLAHALAIAIVVRWENEVAACFSSAVQRKLDKTNFAAWPVGFPDGRPTT